ncbi:MAG: tRNA (adenosine(37)-N6)-threonylcarbamoyltransferase complex dimerization subunit type 1 TsaB [Rhodospirillales bacterium]|nr:tRNA (adenosine(37)-N6)-threonylcarbamoyltransferase complex dimerization subunit type 1 TsaB [Rhodospirillales bacterium]MCB9995432.1 tRNA (adenosine(37)-N6)-threonylcarbamoyltransferase complex dimerization subunit type 1 TsaB [Rhodospirillales bacterium]
MSDPCKVLVFDTALFGCTAGLYDAGTQSCVSEQKSMTRGQAEVLVPMIQSVMDKAGHDFTDVDLIGVTTGPGAFTGLRLGMATAQGFGIALDTPVVGLCTLDILARQFFAQRSLTEAQVLCVLIETKRQDYYCRFYNADGSAASAPQALEKEAIEGQAEAFGDVLYIGDALERFGLGEDGFSLPDPAIMAKAALEIFAADGAAALEPLYLRSADVSKSKKQQRTILGQ